MAKDLYGPILDRRNKAEKIRITLNILERWKFFFDLPRKLQECLRLVTIRFKSIVIIKDLWIFVYLLIYLFINIVIYL